jgi:predicted ATPase
VQEADKDREAGDRSSAALRLSGALGLWRGRPCPDLDEHSWATAEVARLEELRRTAQEELAEARLEAGDHHAMVGDLEAAATEQPLRERRWAQLILALYRCDRQADALRSFARLRSTLAEELGIGPSPDLVALERSILLQSSDLDYHAPPVSGRRPSTTPRRRSVLPTPPNSFIGRSLQVTKVANLVREGRLVTLSGAAGCGKTRLALAVAAQLGNTFGGGSHFVPLAQVSDPGLLVQVIAEALAVRPQSGRPVIEVIFDVVGDRGTLVVLDNCEHVVSAAALLTADLLQGAPGLRVLATSRDPLRINGETVWPVPPLEVPALAASAAESRGCEAVELFIDRAVGARPNLRLDDGAIGAIAEITRRLDGMPLAIELAAARAAALEPPGILAGLSDRFGLLKGGPRTAPPRQQTLRAAVQWSYDLLEAREQDLFCRLSVVPGSFSLEAAVGVAGMTAQDATEALFGLVSKSMLDTVVGRPGQAMRYAMLETMRQFGTERLDDLTADQVRRDHANFYLNLAHSAGPEPGGTRLSRWLKGLDLDFHNVRAALSYLEMRPERRSDLLRVLFVLRRYWFLRRHRQEGLRFIQRALSSAGPTDDLVLVAQVTVAATWASAVEAAEAAARYAERGRELALEAADAATVALASAGFAQVRGLALLNSEEEGLCALELARQIGSPVLVCEALLGAAVSLNAEYSASAEARVKGHEYMEQLLATAEQIGDPIFSCVAHDNLSIDDDRVLARAHIGRCLELVDELEWEAGWVHIRHGEVLLAESDPCGGLRAVHRGLEAARREDSAYEMAIGAEVAGSCALALGADEDSARFLAFARRERNATGFGNLWEQCWSAELDGLSTRLGANFAPAIQEGEELSRLQVADLVSGLAERRLLPWDQTHPTSQPVTQDSAT